MNDCSVDAAFVHQGDGLVRGKGRHLTMRKIARQAASPEVNLGIDDLHHALPQLLAPLVQPAPIRLLAAVPLMQFR